MVRFEFDLVYVNGSMTTLFRQLALSTALLLLGPGNVSEALAERWLPVSTGDDDLRHFIDLDSIKRNGNFVSFWVETINYPEQDLPQFLTRSRIGADCVQRIWRFQEQYEARDGEIITVHKDGDEGPVNILAPGNPRSAVLDYICEGAPLTVSLEANIEANAPSERLLLPEPRYSCSDFGDAERASAVFNFSQPDKACITLVEW